MHIFDKQGQVNDNNCEYSKEKEKTVGYRKAAQAFDALYATF